MRTPVRATMTQAEEDGLLDEIFEVLDRVIDTSGCRDMAPLWFVATQRVRADHLRRSEGQVMSVPAGIRQWAKSMRSKYAALAAWRHAMLHAGVLDELEGARRRAVEEMYFTPYERNEAPYSWSRASSRAPGAAGWVSIAAFDARARHGCAESVRRIAEHAVEMRSGRGVVENARADFFQAGARDGTLKDVLRYDALERDDAE